jgi:L-iditol 2-dehydrogenase
VKAARLHGPRIVRIDEIGAPPSPGPGIVQIHVRAVGLCGSDLHTYREGRIGDTTVQAPLVLGHEFAGVVSAVGPDALDGAGHPLREGVLVAVDPAQPCGTCELCREGHPNLCLHLRFCGLYPDGGALCEFINMPAATCFPLPESLDPAAGAMLEPLGVAMHALHLAAVRPGQSVSVHGAGPVGLLIIQLARLAGADPIFVVERLPWRLEKARAYGAVPIHEGEISVSGQILDLTGGRGVDVAVEAGWAGELVQQALDAVRFGGRLVLVGIPDDDVLTMRHSTARRKGLTLLFSRRMKFTYPGAIAHVEDGEVDVASLITHQLPLTDTPDGFALNERYDDGVIKVMILP